jgi:Ca2+-binding EF-hand superfamily protein
MYRTLLLIFSSSFLLSPVMAEEGKGGAKSSVSKIKDALMKHLDKDGDGKISDKDKESLFNVFKKDVLSKYDADKDGKLSPEEKMKAKEALEGLAKKGKGATGDKTEPNPLLKQFDKDGDGKLSETEQAQAQKAMNKLLGDEKQKAATADKTKNAPAKAAKPTTSTK